MFPNNFNGYGFNQQYVAPRKPRFTNPLSEEDKKSLKTQAGFTLEVTDKEMKQAICTHKDGDKLSVTQNPDGTYTCWVCGETFNLVDCTPEEVEVAVNTLIDILQSIKFYYLDIPEGVVKEFFQMIPFIKKVPGMYKLALNNFKQYETPMTNLYNNSARAFSVYDAVSNPGYNMYNPNMGYQQPGYNYNYQQQPNYGMPNYGTPVGQFGYVDNGMNPGMFQAQPQMQPQVQQNQQQQQQPAFPQPGKPSDTVVQTKTFAL